MKQDETGAWSTQGGNYKCIQNFGREYLMEYNLGNPVVNWMTILNWIKKEG